jgi:lipid-binding SYLF domain-containing protein
MTRITRRFALAGAFAATALTAACGNGIGSRGADNIDARVAATLNYMEQTYPSTVELREKASGLLVMPLITEAGLGFGGSYGRGALVVDGVTVDYYSAAQASFGLQIGAQQYAHVLFFMTPQALADFRSSSGWVAGANVEYAFSETADTLLADTTTITSPVIGFVFGQTGLRAGATVDGTKYTRIIP